MHQNAASILAAGAALLLGVLAPTANASPLTGEPLKLYRDLLKRDPPAALPQSATDDELTFQPSLDFDTDGCYNTPAIDADGNVAEGLDHNYTGGADECRDESDLDNNNVYVRTRCNNGWCAYLYDYYFEKDVAVQHVIDAGGHRHDWEHIAVFVRDGAVQVVAASAHGDYDTKSAGDVRMDGDTHPKIVYHKDGGSTHAFRFANEADDGIENAKGVWFRGALVDWDGFPGTTRDTLVGHDFGSASFALKDDSYQGQLDKARDDLVEGFDSGVDE
ncbi:putative secreted protein [Eutypa lata UCREL1]|uniref:Putative secreted protein n=1 Tax=Eutypa lata (strain UCR-EL1) TaxID=1287681 RepID=M7SJ90_EUTLA|nr:putative secreted protein [Eutypa lata UCREL1]